MIDPDFICERPECDNEIPKFRYRSKTRGRMTECERRAQKFCGPHCLNKDTVERNQRTGQRKALVKEVPPKSERDKAFDLFNLGVRHG